MALVLTKKIRIQWDGPVSVDPAFIMSREALVNRYVAEDRTDGFWEGNAEVTIRSFINTASAQEFIKEIADINLEYNRVILSSSITDI
jgi:hypothetical protein